MKLAAILLVIALSGCATAYKDKEVVVQKEYIVRTAPAVMKTLPPLPTDLPASASNVDVARWVNNNEEYTSLLESMIKSLISFYEKPTEDSK